jgi:YibE/F-like protein
MAIILVSLYLSHGIGRKTTAAVVGTGLALILTAALTAGFVAATSLTGLASEDALNASFQAGGLSPRGLLLAGIIIGGLGVLDDVTMSQASLVFQLRRADPTASFAKLVAGALAVGRDHIAATVNTLFLAYAGASLPLLVLFTTGGDSLGTVATAEAAAVEIVPDPLWVDRADRGRAADHRAGRRPDQPGRRERPVCRRRTAPGRTGLLCGAWPAKPRTRSAGVRDGPGPACAAVVACRRWRTQRLASP